MVDVVSSFLAAFDEREKATSVVGTLEEFFMLISPLWGNDVLRVIRFHHFRPTYPHYQFKFLGDGF